MDQKFHYPTWLWRGGGSGPLHSKRLWKRAFFFCSLPLHIKNFEEISLNRDWKGEYFLKVRFSMISVMDLDVQNIFGDAAAKTIFTNISNEWFLCDLVKGECVWRLTEKLITGGAGGAAIVSSMIYCPVFVCTVAQYFYSICPVFVRTAGLLLCTCIHWSYYFVSPSSSLLEVTVTALLYMPHCTLLPWSLFSALGKSTIYVMY